MEIAQGSEAFEKAIDCIQSWKQFDINWTFVDPKTPVEQGAGVAVNARVFGLWLSNPLQVTLILKGNTNNVTVMRIVR